MRAICGAIITAGSLLGLGLAAIGFGMRYQLLQQTQAAASAPIKLGAMDSALALAFVVPLCGVLVGLTTTFVGLAYHHERRHREHLRDSEMFKSASANR